MKKTKKTFRGALIAAVMGLALLLAGAFAVLGGATEEDNRTAKALYFASLGRLEFFYDDTDHAYEDPTAVYPIASAMQTVPWTTVSGNIEKVVIDESFADFHGLTSTAEFFYDMLDLTEIVGLEYLDTSNVTDMREMFANCRTLTYIDVSGFDTSEVEDMSGMFSGCSSLVALDLSGFDGSAVVDMTETFADCASLPALDLSGFTSEHLTSLCGTFKNCLSLLSVDLSALHTAAVTSFEKMFYGCYLLTEIDLRNFDTASAETFEFMFGQCDALRRILAEEDTFVGVQYAASASMFLGCLRLCGAVPFDAQRTDGTMATKDGYLSIEGDPDLYAILKGTTLTYYYDGFDRSADGDACYAGLPLDADVPEDWDIGNLASVRHTVTRIVIDKSMRSAKLKSLNFMFSNFSSLTEIVGLRDLNTSSVITMSGTFQGCRAIESLDLSGFDTSCVTDMTWTFALCVSLKTILASDSFTLSAVATGEDTFYGCYALMGQNGTGYGAGETDYTMAVFDDYGVDGYFSRKIPYAYLSDLQVTSDTRTRTLYFRFDDKPVPADAVRAYYLPVRFTTEMEWEWDVLVMTGEEEPAFEIVNADITNAVFDPSFADYSPQSLAHLFDDCEYLTSIEGFEYLDTSCVRTMKGMFYGCEKLRSLDLSSFDTSSVHDMSEMFAYCGDIRVLDLTTFETPYPTNVDSMFTACSSLEKVFVSYLWNPDCLVTQRNVFDGCESLVGECGTEYYRDNIGVEYARIDTAENPGYFTFGGTIRRYDLPKSVADFVYNNECVTAYSDTDGYTVTGGSATDPGTYTAVFTLKPNCEWNDGASDEYRLTWKILPCPHESVTGNICDRCGTDLTVPAVRVRYCNLAFESNVYLVFAVETRNVDASDLTFRLWRAGDGDYDPADDDCEVLPVYAEDYEIGGELFTVFVYDKLSAKEMTDDVYVAASAGGETSPTVKYSILTYATKKIATSENELLIKHLQNMLAYGASAQKLFSYKTDRLADATYFTVTLVGATFADGTTQGLYQADEGFRLYADEGTPACFVDGAGTVYEPDGSGLYHVTSSVTLRPGK